VAATHVNGVEAALRLIADELTATRRSWALVGGLAVSARAEPRTTRDVDVVVAVSDDSAAEAFVLELRTRGFRAQAAVEQDPQGRLATVRLVTPGEPAHGTVVDLLFASSGIEAEVAARATPIEILPGLVLPVASIGHLVALKVLARDDRRRPQDLGDLRGLLREADATDRAEARHALEQIEARGYSRGRDLQALFDEVLLDDA
jgi:predicted nucleotidyltransferase